MSAISARSENGLTIMSQLLKRKNLPMYTPKAFSHITAQMIKPETQQYFFHAKSLGRKIIAPTRNAVMADKNTAAADTSFINFIPG